MDFVNTVMSFDWPSIFKALLAFVGAASVIAQMTPTQVDDNIWAKVGKVVNFFALNWGFDKPTAPKV